jgi:hypothetical protein
MLAALNRLGPTEQPKDDRANESNGVSLQRSPIDHIGELMMSVMCSRGRETGLLLHDSMREGLKQWIWRTLAITATTITTNNKKSRAAHQGSLLGGPCNAQQRVNEHRC